MRLTVSQAVPDCDILRVKETKHYGLEDGKMVLFTYYAVLCMFSKCMFWVYLLLLQLHDK